MINNVDFAKRLKMIIAYYHLSASSFADKIGVQRSSISHLLSGRNRPSLDFVLKTVKEFEEVELYWLLNGKGTFPNVVIANNPLTINVPVKDKDALKTNKNIDEPVIISNANKTIERIVLFYTDGTFKEYLK